MSASIPKSAADFETILSAEVEVGATSFTISSAEDEDGNNLAAGLYAFTLDGDTNYKEYVIGVLSGTTVTSVSHVSRQGVLTSGTATYHRRGAQVAITDWTVIGKLGAAARGDAGYDSSAPLYYDGNPTFASDAQIVTKKYVDDRVNGGTVSYNQVVLTSQTAGENLTANDYVYFKESDQRWYKVDADLTATFSQLKLGYAAATQTTGNTLSIVVMGILTGFTGLTAGSKYYASNTAGAISTTPGTYTVYAGTALSTTVMIVDQYVRDIPTGAEKDALAGTQGVPNSSNKYVTNDNTSSATTDQSQLTANSTQVFGAASTTGLQNRLAQSFIPAKTKIRGVNLDKDADTGTFTGTVTVSIQADSAGAPSGVALATVTISNATWLATPVGAFEALFASEYASLTVGSTYWIVAETSTADTANHPNLGANSAGGYSSGSVKYYNAVDGWVAIPTIDLYFATLEGDNSQIIKSNTSGQVPMPFLSTLAQTLEGVLPSTYRKLYYNMYLPFILWVGATDNAADTAFDNWLRNDANDVVVCNMGAFARFTSSDAAYLYLGTANGPFIDNGGNNLEWGDSNVVIMDWWADLVTADDEVHMGFVANDSGLTQESTGNNIFVGFMFDGSLLYIKTANGSSRTVTEITGYTLTQYNNYRVELDLGADSANFYINGTLVGTISATISGTTSPVTVGYGRFDDAVFTVTAPHISLEMNP